MKLAREWVSPDQVRLSDAEIDELARAVIELSESRDHLSAEVARLSFYETTSAADAIRDLHETRAERDKLRALLAEALEIACHWIDTQFVGPMDCDRLAMIAKEAGL